MVVEAKPKPLLSIPTEKEAKLLQLLRDLNYGQVTIFVKEKQPIRAEVIKQSIEF